jgi:hypothetical protein
MRADVLLFSHDVDRGIRLDSKAFSPLIDSTIEKLQQDGLTCKSILLPWSKLSSRNAFNTPLNISSYYLFCRTADIIITKTGKMFGVHSEGRIVVGFYKILFEIYRPKIIICIGATPQLCVAAKEVKVPIVELLHGIGYAKIPWGWETAPRRNIPEIVFALDKVSLDTFMRVQDKRFDVHQVSHPFFNRTLSSLNYQPKEWCLNTSSTKNYARIVLITLSWGYAGDHGPYPELIGILKNGLLPEEIIDAIRESKGKIFWRIRMHPVQMAQKKYHWVRKFLTALSINHSNLEWEDSSRVPLHSLLATCDAHITMNSMSSYECAYSGVKTMALCPTLRSGGVAVKMFEDLVASGYLLKESPDKAKILNWINQTARCQPLDIGLHLEIVEIVKKIINQSDKRDAK